MQIQSGRIQVSRLADVLKSLLRNRARLYKTVGGAVFLFLTIYFATPGICAARSAYQKYLSAKTSYIAQKAKANDISMQETALKEAQDKFERLSSKFIFSVDTGQTLDKIEGCCKQNGVKLNSIQPGNAVEKVYQGHLMAVPVKFRVTGSFPNILKLMDDLENNGNPAEYREVKISANEKGTPGDVTADLTVVFYSLCKPEKTQYVIALSGNYNPFFTLIQPPQNIQSVQNQVQQTRPGAGQQLPLVNQVLPGNDASAQAPVLKQPTAQSSSSGQQAIQPPASGQQTAQQK